jgi:cell division transport system permease protein
MSVRYVIREGLAGISRTKLAAFTSIFSLFVAVLLIGVIARVGYNAYEVAQMLRQQVEVEVFLLDLDQQSTLELQKRLGESVFVESLTYISKDSASQIFRQEFGIGGEALAELNFLPASFKLKIADNAELDSLQAYVAEIETYRGVDEVQFNLALLQMLESRMETMAIVGGALGLFILFVAMILVFNTIRLTIYAKRDLIRAMKLVGATNAFIRRPFLVEGMVQGLIAGAFACVIIYLIFSIIVPAQVPQVGILEWPFGRWHYLMGGVMLLSLFMGWWGSRWAARKFIRETTVYS